MTDYLEKQYQLLYEEAPVPYQALDADGCILRVNRAWLDELGYSMEEVIGRWFGDFLVPEQQPLFRERFTQFKHIGHVENVDFEMVTKDGRTTSVLFEGTILYDALGNFKQTHCVFTNITERKKIGQAMERKVQELEHMNKLMVDRELKMVELKKRIEELEKGQ